MSKKIIYEYDVLIDERPDEDDGWETYKTEAYEQKLGWHKTEIVSVYHVRRDITPVTIMLNLKVTVPAWRKEHKKITAYDFMSPANSELVRLGLYFEED